MNLDKIVEKFTSQLTAVISKETQRQIDDALRSVLGGKKTPRAKTTVDMTCRFPRCKARSKGPRFKYMCEDHIGKKIPTAPKKRAVAKKPVKKMNPLNNAPKKKAKKKPAVKKPAAKVTAPKPTLSVVKPNGAPEAKA